MPTYPRHQGRLVICLHVLGDIATRVERQVHVRIDQARQEGDIAQFDQRQLHRGTRPGKIHANDAVTLDHHQRHAPAQHDLSIKKARRMYPPPLLAVSRIHHSTSITPSICISGSRRPSSP